MMCLSAFAEVSDDHRLNVTSLKVLLFEAEAVLKQGVRLEPNYAVFAKLASLAPRWPWLTARVGVP